MSVAKESARCPYCREPIAIGAIRCKHCHADLAGPKKKVPIIGPFNTFRVGFLAGILFLIVVEILIYLQCYAGE